MGWAEVIESKQPDVKVESEFGAFSICQPPQNFRRKADNIGFKDISQHRLNHPSVYVQFDRASAFTVYEPAREDQDILLRGLYTTSWLVEDFLTTNELFGA